MSLQIGNRNFNVSETFKNKLISSVKNDSFIDKTELSELKASAVSEDEKSAVALLEKKNDDSSINLALSDDDGINPTSFRFNVKVEKISIQQGESSNKDKVERFTAKVADPVVKSIFPIVPEQYKNVDTAIKKLPDGELKSFLKSETESIFKNTKLTPERRNELLDTIGREIETFSKRQVIYTKELDELKTKYPPEKLSNEIKEIKDQVEQLKSLIKTNPNDNTVKLSLQSLEKKLSDSESIKRRLDSLVDTISEKDAVRLRDVVNSTKKTFGPPYHDAVAKRVNELLESKPELKKIFRTPEDVNTAIRKFPSDLKPEELNALKEIRNSFHVVPKEGLAVVKVDLPNKSGSLKKFVIEAEHLKGVKTPEELIDLLKLDYKNSDFIKDGKPSFKLEDIQVYIGKVYESEVTPPFSKEFGGTRDTVIYQYPFSGNGFTTPENGFPKPELDIGAKGLPESEVKVVKWNEFQTGDVAALAPDRVPSVITDTSKRVEAVIDKLPESELKEYLKSETESIKNNKNLSFERRSELLDTIGKETETYSKRQISYTKELEELKLKYPPEKIASEIKETENQIENLKKALELKPDDKSLKTSLEALEKKLGDAKGIERRTKSLSKTIGETDSLRLKDIVESTKKTFGPPYHDAVAKRVNELLESKPELKKIFRTPEDVNTAIRKFPSDLKPEELNALKEIRNSFHIIPAEGIPVVKVSFPGEKAPLQKFVIEAEHLKSVKTPEELIDLLKLDYHNSPFIKNGKPTFKLEDIQVTVGRVFPDEVSVPFSKEFGGSRDTVIYQYPFSGNGFTTPDGGFPKPELDLGAKGIHDSEVKVINWNEFQEKDISTVAPERKAPEPKTKKAEVKPQETEKNISTPDEKNNIERSSGNQTVKPKEEINSPKANEGTTEIGNDLVKSATQNEERIAKLPIDENSKELLKKVLQKDEFKGNPKAVENLLKTFEHADETSTKVLSELIKETDSKVIAKVFENEKVGEEALTLIQKVLPAFEKVGATATEAIAKIAKGLGKALPVLGGVASAYDAANLGAIALKGKDLHGKDFTHYPKGDPRNTPENLAKLKDIRALALVGSAANTVDTVLAVIEATGVGNIDLPVQLGLAGAELLIDFAVDYFYEHPDKLPKELSLGIKATALAGAIAFAPAGTAAVSQIYGLDGIVDIANELTKITGESALKGIKKLNDLSNKALDTGLKSFAGNVNKLADVIRNPEKYAQAFGKSIEQVLSEAKEGLKSLVSKGGKVAEKVFNTLADIASNPGKYAKQAIEIGRSLVAGTKDVFNTSLNFTKKLVEKGALKVNEAYEYLSKITVKGLNVGKEFLKDAVNSAGKLGTEFKNLLADVYKSPQKYGRLAVEFISSVEDSIKNGSVAAFNKLNDLAASGVVGAKKAILSAAENIKAGAKNAYELAKFIVQNPKEASIQALNSAKNTLINVAKTSKQLASQALNYLGDLQNRVGGALGRFSDTLVDLAKQGGELAKEILTSHLDVIKRRLPEIIDAFSNLGVAVKDQLIKLIPGRELINSLLQSGANGFKTLIDLASNSKDIAQAFIEKLGADFSQAWDKSSIINIKPFTDLIGKYYDQAKAIGGKVLQETKSLLYQAIHTLDKSKLNDKIPDICYSFLKP